MSIVLLSRSAGVPMRPEQSVLYLKDSVNPNHHHCLLAEDVPPGAAPGATLVTVEGNIDAQKIAIARRWCLQDVGLYHRTVAKSTSAKAP